MRSRGLASIIFILCVISVTASAQAILGSITGTAKDATGSAIPAAAVTANNMATGLTVKAATDGNGSYLIPNLPAGTYEVMFKKEGFDTETHTQVLAGC